MTNAELVNQFRIFADLLEIKGENAFRANAYRRAADAIAELDRPVQDLVAERAVTEIPNVGPGIAATIEEIARTGRFSQLDEMLDEVPGTLLTMLDIPGVGPKTVGRFYRELGITDLTQLEAAAESGRIRTLKGFGERQEQRILKGIAFLHRRTGRLSIGTALPDAEAIAHLLRERLGIDVRIAGSVRRRCITVGNIDLVAVTSEPDRVEGALRDVPGISDVVRTEDSVVAAQLDHGVELRAKLTSPGRFGTELVRWTGSREHVARLEEISGGSLPEAPDEEALYEALGMQWIPPELRESGTDALRLAADRALPQLVTLDDIMGDLHLHSHWSDGHNTILELALAARERGYAYLSVTDHSGGLAVARGLSAERLREQRRAIAEANELVPEVRLFWSSEVEVHRDGRLDYPDELLAELDIVVASLHSGLGMSRAEQTTRIIRVLENPNVDIVAHPTGRIVERRPGAEYDWAEVFRVARETGTALEINANPARLDLDDTLARAAHEAGVIIAIDSDAHDLAALDLMRYGVGVARRAGLEPEAIVNTRSLPKLLAWLRR